MDFRARKREKQMLRTGAQLSMMIWLGAKA